MCCFDGCYRQCTLVTKQTYIEQEPTVPTKPKPGFCPGRKSRVACNFKNPAPNGTLGSRCGSTRSDQYCEGALKCCPSSEMYCGPVCSPPVLVKPGKCPDVQYFNNCTDITSECNRDPDCNGRRKCCFSGCYKECMTVGPSPNQNLALADNDDSIIISDGTLAVSDNPSSQTSSNNMSSDSTPAWAIALVVVFTVMLIAITVLAVKLYKWKASVEKP